MPVASASNEFVVRDAADWPGTDGVANAVRPPSWRCNDVRFARHREPATPCDSIAQYEGEPDPSRVVAKDAEKEVDDTCGRRCQRCPIGIAEVGRSDYSWLERARRWHIAFDGCGVRHELDFWRLWLTLSDIERAEFHGIGALSGRCHDGGLVFVASPLLSEAVMTEPMVVEVFSDYI